MPKTIEAVVNQSGPSTSTATTRGHTVTVDRPTDKGGTDKGPMGGELLLFALGGCFMSNLLAAVRTREASVSNASVTVKATIEGTPERMTHFEITVRARFDDEDEMKKLATIAARGCLVSNTLAGDSEVKVVVAPERRGPNRPPNHG